MKQRDVFNKIGSIIKELNEQYKYIQENPANLNELELELFVANSKFLADHAEILIRLNKKTTTDDYFETSQPTEEIPEKVDPSIETSQPAKTNPAAEQTPIKSDPPVDPTPTIKEKFFEPVVQAKFEIRNRPLTITPKDESAPAIDLSADTPEDSYSFIREEPEVIRHELEVNEADFDEEIDYTTKLAEEPEIDEAPAAQHPLIKEEPVIEEPVAVVEEPVAPPEEPVKPAAEKKELSVNDDVLTINQKMAANLSGKPTLATVQPIDNLKQAITLNDKLWFIKDLFNGYSLAYSEAIEILNRFTSIAEAERFLDKNYVVKNKWAEKPDTTAKFYELLRRRYSI